jgi:hypothetical protein
MRRVKAGIGVFARISAVLAHINEIHMGNPGTPDSASHQTLFDAK